MSDTAGTPDVVIADVKETIRDAVAGPWVKRWFDIRTFLAQRRALMRDPKLTLDVEIRTSVSGWKTPLKFATQGLILPALAVQLLTMVLSLVLVRPTPYMARLREEAESALEKVKQNTEIVATASATTIFAPTNDLRNLPTPLESTNMAMLGVQQADYLKALKNAEPKLREAIRQIKTGENIDAAGKVAVTLLPSVAFVLAAFAFRVFARKHLSVSSSHDARRAHEVFLYTHTSCLFWANVVMLLVAAIIQHILVYTGEFDRTMYAAAHNGPVEAVLTLLLIGQMQMFATLLIAAPWLIIGWRRFVRQTRAAYDLPARSVWRDPILGAAFAANLVAFIFLVPVVNLVTWAYGHGVTAIEERKISLDPSAPRT